MLFKVPSVLLALMIGSTPYAVAYHYSKAAPAGTDFTCTVTGVFA